MFVSDAFARVSLLDRVRASFAPSAEETAVAPAGRDARLDMFRGLALVMIFINHVPGNFYEQFTSRNFGFSDAAEAFVFMSGMAAGLAYTKLFINAPLWPAIARIWGRARQLYFVHLSITLMALAIFATAALYFGAYELLGKNNLAPIFAHPLQSMIGIPLLTHQLGYLNILPLYAVLLVATPLLLPLALRWPLPTLGASILLWIVAGQFRLNFPNYPNSGGWFFNPLSWQLIFLVGLLCGSALKQGRSFVPRNRILFATCSAIVLVVLVWVKVPVVAAFFIGGLRWLSDAGVPFYITWFDKTFLALPRLVHALALFYVLAYLPQIRHFAASSIAAPLRLLGRHGLAIFATGTVLSLALQAVRVHMKPDVVGDALMMGSGLLLLWGLAFALETVKRR